MNRMRMIFSDASVLLKTFLRQKSTLVWIVVIPVILTTMCCSVIAAFDTEAVYVYVQDKDDTNMSKFVTEKIGENVVVVMVDPNLSVEEAMEQMKNDNRYVSGLVVFEKGFKEWLLEGVTKGKQASFMLYTDEASYEIYVKVTTTDKPSSNDKFGIALSTESIGGGASKSAGSLVQQIFGEGTNLYDHFSGGITIAIVCEVLLGLTIGMSSNIRQKGVSKMIRNTELKKWHSLFAYAMWSIIPTFVVSAITLTIISLYSLIHITPLTVLIVLLSGLCACSMGLAISLLVRNSQSASIAASAVLIPLLLVSGALIPLELMPSWFQVLSYVSPMTFMVSGFKGSIGLFVNLDPSICVVVLALFTVLFGMIWLLLENRMRDE